MRSVAWAKSLTHASRIHVHTCSHTHSHSIFLSLLLCLSVSVCLCLSLSYTHTLVHEIKRVLTSRHRAPNSQTIYFIEVASGYCSDPVYMYLDSNLIGLVPDFSIYHKLEATNREKDIASKGWLAAAGGDSWCLATKGSSQKHKKTYHDTMLNQLLGKG